MAATNQTFRQHLDELLASTAFQASPISSRLLRYLVTETLAGREDRLKGYTIAIDVFDRNTDFDPATESVVRVQVGRLRKLLDDHYASPEGQGHPFRLVIPKGQYVPRLEPAQALPSVGSPPPGRKRWSNPGLTWSVAIGAALLTLILAIGWFRKGEEPVEEPRLFVSAYRLLDRGEAPAIFVEGLQKELIVQLSRFPDLAVIGFDTADGQSENRRPRLATDIDYVLGGTVESVGPLIRVSSILKRSSTGEILWSSVSTIEMTEAEDLFQEETRIALRVASEHGQSYGVIQQATKAAIAEGRGVPLRQYRCILGTYDYMRSKTVGGHASARECLERLVRASPHYAHAWGLLSWIYGDEARLGFNRRPGEDPMARALRAARKGVETNPTNAVAQQFLGIALFYSGNEQAARQTMQTAVSLSPNNAEILANTGWILAQIENDDEARKMIEEAIALNPGHPPWYWGGLAIDSLRRGDGTEALRFARQVSEDDPLAPFLLAAALRLSGDDRAADLALRRSGHSRRYGASSDEEFLRRHNFPEPLIRLATGIPG